MSCLAGCCYCNLWGPQLGKIVHDLSSLGAYIASFGTIKAIQQEGCFLHVFMSYDQIIWCPQQLDLTVESGGQLRVMIITCIVWGGTRALLLVGGILQLALGFLYNNVALGRTSIHPCREPPLNFLKKQIIFLNNLVAFNRNFSQVLVWFNTSL